MRTRRNGWLLTILNALSDPRGDLMALRGTRGTLPYADHAAILPNIMTSIRILHVLRAFSGDAQCPPPISGMGENRVRTKSP